MSISFTQKEAFLGLATIVGWADGENQKSEVDTKVNMIFHESISSREISDFQQKYDRLGTYESVFTTAIETLAKGPKEDKARAVAWMLQVANVSQRGIEGELDYDEDVWKRSSQNLDEAELDWIDRARESLLVTSGEVREQYQLLPRSRRI